MEFLKVGKIVNTHGIRGEVKIYPYTDNIDNLSKIKSFYFDESLNEKIKVLSKKIVKNTIIFKLENVDTVDNAKTLINKYIYIEKEKIKENNTYYIEDLIGLKVYDKERYLGNIINVFQTGANDVYEIEKEDKTKLYLPAIKEVILNISLKDKKVLVNVMEGLE